MKTRLCLYLGLVLSLLLLMAIESPKELAAQRSGTESGDQNGNQHANDFDQENMIATLTTLFGVLGLVLAAVGLYGVMAYTVEQRTSEIGVRMALGADRGSVIKMVLRGAFSQVGIGLALGIPAAIAAGRTPATALTAPSRASSPITA